MIMTTKKWTLFNFTCLRRIIQIRWTYAISNEEPLSKTNLKWVSQEVMDKIWIGHVLRMKKGTTVSRHFSG